MKRSYSKKLERIKSYTPDSVFVCVIGQHPRELLQGLYWSYCYFAERWPSHIYVHSVNPKINKKEIRDFFDEHIKQFWLHIKRIPLRFNEEFEFVKPKLTICISNTGLDSFYQETLNSLNENLFNISASEKKLLSISKNDVEFNLPMLSHFQAVKTIVKDKCCSFLRLEQITTDGKPNRMDVYVDRYTIDFAYVNLTSPFDNNARDLDYLMARYARKNDNISAVEVKPISLTTQDLKTKKPELDFIKQYKFSCEDSKTIFGEMMPDRLRPSELLAESAEEPVLKSRHMKSHQSMSLSNTVDIPQIELDLVSKGGTAYQPTYQLLINDKAVYLSLKNTTYLCTWLLSSNANYITKNKQLGFEKAYQQYCLVTEQPEKLFNNSGKKVFDKQWRSLEVNDIIGYFRQSEANKLITLVGRKVAAKLKAMPYSKSYDFLEDPELGGYLGGRTENSDKNEFKSSLFQQGIPEQQIEWLVPKSIDDKSKVKDYFQRHKITSKDEVAKTDLGRFLKDQGAMLNLYEDILESKDINANDRNKSSNPKQAKLFVCALPSSNASIYIE